MMINHNWLVVLPSWKIWKSMGRIIPYIMENHPNVWNHQPNKLDKSLDFGAPYFQKKNDTNWICLKKVMGFRCLDTGAGGEPNVGCKISKWRPLACSMGDLQDPNRWSYRFHICLAYVSGLNFSEYRQNSYGHLNMVRFGNLHLFGSWRSPIDLLAFLSGCHGVSTCVSFTAMLRLLLRPWKACWDENPPWPCYLFFE